MELSPIERRPPPAQTPEIVEVLLNMRSLQDADRALRAACLGGLLAGVYQVGGALVRVSEAGITLAVLASLAGALLLFGLVFGVTRYSRASAIGLLAVFSLGQAWAWTQGGLGAGAIVISIVLIFVFVRGVQATFAHHRLARRFHDWQRSMDSALDPRLFEDGEGEA